VSNDCDSSAHFHIHDDPNGPENDRPQKLITKICTCLRGENDLTEIEKASEGRHGSQGHSQVLSHKDALVA
jgi:hypothetical protein